MQMVHELIQNTRPWLPEMVELEESFKSTWSSHQLTNNGPIQCALEQEISSFLGVKNICLFSSGATALIAAFNITKIKRDIGWCLSTDISDGLAKTVRFFISKKTERIQVKT